MLVYLILVYLSPVSYLSTHLFHYGEVSCTTIFIPAHLEELVQGSSKVSSSFMFLCSGISASTVNISSRNSQSTAKKTAAKGIIAEYN